ncbi:unnamed protein product, partial [Heligmosomoides polygyrus]|uniref:C2H2-type domain-containing protein n=1 Tax=Heligmosomoides polygyrus TaxID=6339 RepID=A0A183GST9_HELPZ
SPCTLNGLSYQVASTSGASYAEVKHESDEGAVARLAASAHLSQPAYLSDHDYTLKRFPSWYYLEQETKPTASYSRVRRVRPLRKGLQSCDLCQRLFLRRNLFTHLRTVHWYSKEDVLKVKENMRREVSMQMKKVYRSSKELLRMTNTLKGLNTCEVCKKVMPSNDLYSHLEIVHKYSQERIAVVKDEIRREGIAIRNILPVMCPICEERFEGHDDLANHCSAVHSKDGAGGEAQDYSLLSLRFSKIEEFEVWLEEQCERTVTSFYQNCKTGDTYYLRCHRSGKCVPKGKIRVSSTKKTVRNCTCHLNVYLNVDGSIAVKGCFGHVGHSLDAALLRITKPQEIYLKTLLQEYSIDYVLRFCKREFPAKTSRLHHVTRHDLWNIIIRHGLDVKSEDTIGKPKCHPPEDEQDEDYGIPLLEMLADQSEDECVLDRSSPPRILTPSSSDAQSESSHPRPNPPSEKQDLSGLELAANLLLKGVPGEYLLVCIFESSALVARLIPMFQKAFILKVLSKVKQTQPRLMISWKSIIVKVVHLLEYRWAFVCMLLKSNAVINQSVVHF